MQPQYQFSQSPPFQQLFNGLTNLEGEVLDSVIGVVIDFHPLWWLLATLAHDLGGNVLTVPELFPLLALPGRRLIPRPDLSLSEPRWDQFCDRNGKKHDPFLVKLCYRPGTPDRIRDRLREFTRQQVVFCVLEERPLALAASSFDGGRELTASESGTLGGFFKDNNTSNIYGVTCGHVGKHPSTSVTLEDSSGVVHTNVGSVAESSFGSLSALTPGTSCNRSLSGISTQVDAALIKLNAPHTALNTITSIGVIDTIYDRSQFGSGDAVEMYGAKSKRNSYYIGAYDVVYKVLFKNGNLYCFEHMFEINRNAVTSSLVPPSFVAKAVHGDSGACVCRPSPTGNYAYCGTLVAVDGTNGYACFAESVRTWAANLSPSIDLVPL
jgi:hypothetical protein